MRVFRLSDPIKMIIRIHLNSLLSLIFERESKEKANEI